MMLKHWVWEVVNAMEKTPPLAACLDRITERQGFRRYMAKANVGMDEI